VDLAALVLQAASVSMEKKENEEIFKTYEILIIKYGV